MAPPEKVKDVPPPADACKENTLFKKLCSHPLECIVFPRGALVLIRMSYVRKDNKLYYGFKSVDGGDWSLFDFVDSQRAGLLRPDDSDLAVEEAGVLNVHVESFLLPTSMSIGSGCQSALTPAMFFP